MKRILSTVLVVLLLFAIVFPAANAQSNNQQPLSEMTKEECLAFLEKNGIEVPEYFLSEEHIDWLIEYVLEIIVTVEENPYAFRTTGYSVTPTLFDEIRRAVNAYYGIDDVEATSPPSRYTLQYNTVLSSWQELFLNYNCYGYALNRTGVDKSPGYLSNEIYNDLTMPSLATLAIYVKQDLQNPVYSMNCVKITTTRPTQQNLLSGQTAICVRLGYILSNTNRRDFHFMRLVNGNWQHKPGITQPLRYWYLPDVNTPWYGEGVFRNVPQTIDVVYTGALRYIIFKPNHGTTTTVYTGTNYHDGTTHYFLYSKGCPHCDYVSEYFWQSTPCTIPCTISGGKGHE